MTGHKILAELFELMACQHPPQSVGQNRHVTSEHLFSRDVFWHVLAIQSLSLSDELVELVSQITIRLVFCFVPFSFSFRCVAFSSDFGTCLSFVLSFLFTLSSVIDNTVNSSVQSLGQDCLCVLEG